MIVDWTQLDRWITLRLEREGNNWIAADGDTVYMRHPDVLEVGRWMRRFSIAEEGVDLDEWSISQAYEASGEIALAWFAAQAALESGEGGTGAGTPPRGERTASPALTPDQIHALKINQLLADIRDDHSRRVGGAKVIPFPARGDAA